MNNLKQAVQSIQDENNILILPHILPDGDAIGSSIALYIGLKSIGKNPYILLDEEIPSNLKFLPYSHICNQSLSDFKEDLIITVDCSDLDRLGNRKKIFLEGKKTLNIDHHMTNTHFAQNNVVNDGAAATGEIIFHLLEVLKIPITKDIATCLYTSLSTDTGSFKYDNTTFITHKIAGELLKTGIELNKITASVYHNKPIYKIKLLRDVLNTLELYFSNQLAIMYISKEMLEKSGAIVEDTEGFIEYARDIEGVEVGILLKELSENETKVGFRSKYNFDVGKVAQRLGGGGHKKASGCTIYNNIHKAKEMIIHEIGNDLR